MRFMMEKREAASSADGVAPEGERRGKRPLLTASFVIAVATFACHCATVAARPRPFILDWSHSWTWIGLAAQVLPFVWFFVAVGAIVEYGRRGLLVLLGLPLVAAFPAYLIALGSL